MVDARAQLLRHAGLDDEAALLASALPGAADTARVAVLSGLERGGKTLAAGEWERARLMLSEVAARRAGP